MTQRGTSRRSVVPLARVCLWLCGVALPILTLDRVGALWPRHSALAAVVLVLFAGCSCVMLIDALHRQGSLRSIRHLVSLRTLVTVLAAVTTAFALFGLLFYISPTLFAEVASVLPASVQDMMVVDYILRGGTGFWVFAIVSFVLWGIRSEVL